jgi:hypothetical protein
MQTHENAPCVTVKCYSEIGENHWIEPKYSFSKFTQNIFAPVFRRRLGFPIVSVRTESHAPSLEPLAAAIRRAYSDAQGQDQGPLFAR